MNIPAITNPFWKHFSRYLLVGFSALLLFAISQQNIIGDFSNRGPQIATAYEVGECIQFSDGYWRFTGGEENDDANWVPCNSGNSDDGQVPPPPPPAPVCTPVDEFKYNQCVACNESEPVYQNTCTGEYTTGPRQHDPACASFACPQTPPPPVITPPPPSITPPPPVITPPPPAPIIPPPPAPIACPKEGQAGTQLYCGGTVWGYDECKPVDYYSDGSVKYYTCKFSGNRVACIGSVTCPAPAQTVTPPPPPTQRPECPVGGQSGTKILTDCGNQWGYDSCVAEGRYSNGAPRSYRCTFSGNNLCQGVIMCPEPASITRQPVVLPPQGAPVIPVVVTNNNNNTNNNSNTNNNNISVSVPTQRETVREVVRFTGNYGVAQPQVVTTQVAGVKELPKTGLPVAAWAALAFLPAGLRIRRFQKVKGHLENSPIYLWEKRQYNSHTENS